MAAHIGTSGWAYKEWKPDFYPQDLPQRLFLQHYSSVLTGCEINATFYRLQAESTVSRWAEETPEDFRFAAKMHRRLTHGRDLAEDESWFAFLDQFMAQLEPLEDRLGALLVQFPPTRQRDDAALARLLNALPDGMPHAVEFRHESWFDPAVTERVTKAGTVCFADTTGAVPASLPPGPLAYVRLRGEHYDDDQREGWHRLIGREAESRPVLVFAKHEGVPAGDPRCGVGLAQWLLSPSP
ncbi:MAG: DUF72 domain-containing protein [Thermoleophilia bacterium]|nr:DUF72 domain-containing protein [Thermoleophilia bacterium]MDH3724403.1 DUF72 domain-containing protein [Thermoleophilia bacterium]